jgi:hypothetical protein
MPPLVYELMDLYPQAGAHRPSVMYVPALGRHQGNGSSGKQPLRQPTSSPHH